MEYKSSREKITQNPKLQYIQISLSYNRDYSLKENTKDRNQNSFAGTRWQLVLLFFSHYHMASFSFSVAALRCLEERKQIPIWSCTSLLKTQNTRVAALHILSSKG
jgi:hypothetical protein